MYDAAELSQLPGLLAGELISSGRALDSTTRENICAILDAAIARAEVADSLAYERLENLLFVEQRADDAEIERDEAIARAEEAEGRAAELEAQLAAQQWRPVTEDWPHYHDRVVIAHWGGTWAQFARRVQSDDGEDEWLLDDGRKFDFESASVALLTSPPPLPH